MATYRIRIDFVTEGSEPLFCELDSKADARRLFTLLVGARRPAVKTVEAYKDREDKSFLRWDGL